jgi:hypothetical protein
VKLALTQGLLNLPLKSSKYHFVFENLPLLFISLEQQTLNQQYNEANFNFETSAMVKINTANILGFFKKKCVQDVNPTLSLKYSDCNIQKPLNFESMFKLFCDILKYGALSETYSDQIFSILQSLSMSRIQLPLSFIVALEPYFFNTGAEMDKVREFIRVFIEHGQPISLAIINYYVENYLSSPQSRKSDVEILSRICQNDPVNVSREVFSLVEYERAVDCFLGGKNEPLKSEAYDYLVNEINLTGRSFSKALLSRLYNYALHEDRSLVLSLICEMVQHEQTFILGSVFTTFISSDAQTMLKSNRKDICLVVKIFKLAVNSGMPS